MSDERVLCLSEEAGIAESLVRLARSLPLGAQGRVEALVLAGAPPGAADRLAGAGADGVTTVSGAESGDPQVVAAAVASVVESLTPTLLLTGSTKRGRELAGRLAGRLDLAVVTGATSITLAADRLTVERETLSGNAIATERVERRPALVAMLPGFDAPRAAPAASVTRAEHPAPVVAALVEVRERRPKPGGEVDVEKAERIVTIGRGLKRKEDLVLIEALARALHAEVGCTRPLAAEAGWLSDDHWIGLTGHRVHPKLYLAVGVSGAVQHLVGMRAAKVVVAVNKDPKAPIFAQSDYALVGDLYQIVPALTKALGG